MTWACASTARVWMQHPIDAEIGGQWNSDGVAVGKDRSYLAGFLWHEAGSGESTSTSAVTRARPRFRAASRRRPPAVRRGAVPSRASATRRERVRSAARR